MEVLDRLDETKIGGIGCKHCKFFQPVYDPDIKNMYSLHGEWGRCINVTKLKEVSEDQGLDDRPEKHHTVILNKLLLLVMFYVTHDYNCKHLRVD